MDSICAVSTASAWLILNFWRGSNPTVIFELWTMTMAAVTPAPTASKTPRRDSYTGDAGNWASLEANATVRSAVATKVGAAERAPTRRVSQPRPKKKEHFFLSFFLSFFVCFNFCERHVVERSPKVLFLKLRSINPNSSKINTSEPPMDVFSGSCPADPAQRECCWSRLPRTPRLRFS